MSNPSSLPDRLSRALHTPTRGVLGLVDELLAISLEHPLQVNWEAGRCRVRFVEDGVAGQIEVRLQQSVLRAALARVAVLCNEQRPNSVTPYRGTGELLVEGDPTKAIRVTFSNTPEEQRLELLAADSGDPTRNGVEEGKETERISGNL
jgi:hypothetical protein